MRKLILFVAMLGLVIIGSGSYTYANDSMTEQLLDTDPPTSTLIINRWNSGGTEMATIESNGEVKTGVVVSESQEPTGSTVIVQVEIGLVVCTESGPF